MRHLAEDARRRDDQFVVSRSAWMAPLSGLVLTRATLLAAACSQSQQPCAGQCYPFQLNVAFRPSATPAADRAAMLKCRENPSVIRIGKVHAAPREGLPGTRAATVVTRSMTGKRPENLVACLRADPEVIGAVFRD
jgi:hypothetical protein